MLKFLAILLISLIFQYSLNSQPSQQDSLFVVQQVSDLIRAQKYASAHELLENYLEEFGINNHFVCLMVDNGLRHHYLHENYDYFYLKNVENSSGKPAKEAQPQIARLRHPRRLLEKVIRQKPDKALAYKLLGDYYNIQLGDLSHFEFAQNGSIKELEEKCFYYYTKAEKLGVSDRETCRWLGDYYNSRNQPETAEKYYQKNIEKSPPDAISLFQLAELSFQKKQYTQAYNYSSKSLKFLKPEDLYLRYDALRMAAISLKELGEETRFLQLINECLKTNSEAQEAYIDLIDYYISNGDTTIVEHTFTEMFLNNPFDRPGYNRLEKYIVSSGHFKFADSLFDRMILKYENWDEALANIYWSKGNIAYHRNLTSEASSFWELSRNYMRKYLPEDHSILKQVGELSRKN